jgi:glycerol-3-phosphate dehydrogenase subunit B
MRLREALEAVLMRQGVQFFNGRRVLAVRDEDCRCPEITVGTPEWRETLEGKGMILATGRFLGGGLTADRNGIRETAFGFPVSQPPAGALWHRERFLDPGGHPINEAGLEIDDQFRPLGRNGRPVFENVFAAGSVLAHQDWIRTKSGAGLAIATAYGAFEAFMRHGGTRRKEDTHKHRRD